LRGFTTETTEHTQQENSVISDISVSSVFEACSRLMSPRRGDDADVDVRLFATELSIAT